ncbi:glucosaminidase domain-containing protein [Paracoccaceae bacterium]|nr:glucosaminidase domain-containing protein [Paracoccaceae bacterium]MDC0869222.1 glucosaminidase domain-containing protein [Paracoccaceae bacterium]
MQVELFSGLAARPNKRQDAIAKFKRAVLPSETTQSFEEMLSSLTDQEMSNLQQKAKMILLSSPSYTTSYLAQVKQMFPNLQSSKQNLLAELMQQISPRDILVEDEEEPTKIRHNTIMAYYDELENNIKSIQPKQKKRLKEEEGPLPTQDDALVIELISALKSKQTIATMAGNNVAPTSEVDTVGVYADREPFLADLAPIAKEVASELGIDPRIVMAQAILETGWGSKVKSNNYFGIKGKGQEVTTHEEVDGLMVKLKDEFRTYDSLEDSVKDYGKFLKANKRYKPLLEAESFNEQIDALAASGYATDTRYGEKIKEIALSDKLKNFGLNSG